MKYDVDDFKWTAYALGEISDPAEIAEIESILEQSPEMRGMVEEIRETANLLNEQLQAEPSLGLTPAQRALIREKASAPRTWFGLKPVWAIACTAVAAALICFLYVRQMHQLAPAPRPIQVAKDVKRDTLTPAAIQEKKKPAEPVVHAANTARKKPVTEIVAPKSAPVESVPEAKPVQTAEIKQPEMEVNVTPSLSAKTWSNWSVSGSFAGTIKDPSGAVVPGASITVKNAESGVETKYTTNNTGSFNAPGLLPGYYDITVQKEGFATASLPSIRLENGVHKLDAKLEAGKKTDIVEINIKAENIILENGPSVGAVIPEDTIAKLPLVNSNVLDLVKVMGGVVMTENPIFGADDTTLAGLSAANVNVQKDGVTANNTRWVTGMNTPVNLNPEMVSEFKVVVAPVDAEMGRGSGQISIGSITGKVVDESGKPVHKAIVKIANSKLSKKCETKEDGSYSISDLQPGSYDISVEKKNYQTAVLSNQSIASGSIQINVQLKPKKKK